MLKRILASVGIGAAKIDTLLQGDTFSPGQDVSGVVTMKGGAVEQSIDTIELCVRTQYLKEVDDKKVYITTDLVKYHVSHPFVIQPGEQKEVPFTFQLPSDTPLTVGKSAVWVYTGLSISTAIDPSDNDRIRVNPTAGQSVVMQALEQLGFRLRSVDCEYHSRSPRKFVQEFEYVPTNLFRNKLDELEVIFLGDVSSGSIELLLQIDRRARGLASLFAEALDMDESFVRFSLSAAQIQAGPAAVASALQAVIEQHS